MIYGKLLVITLDEFGKIKSISSNVQSLGIVVCIPSNSEVQFPEHDFKTSEDLNTYIDNTDSPGDLLFTVE